MRQAYNQSLANHEEESAQTLARAVEAGENELDTLAVEYSRRTLAAENQHKAKVDELETHIALLADENRVLQSAALQLANEKNALFAAIATGAARAPKKRKVATATITEVTSAPVQ